MRILSIGNFLNPSWDGSVPDEEHIAGALEQLGHEVYRVQRENDLGAIQHHKYGWDFVLISQWDGYPSDMIQMIRKNLGFKWAENSVTPKIVYWAFDWQQQHQEWHNRLIEASDLYLSKRIADSKYPNWQWLSQDFAPEFLHKFPDYHNTYRGTIDVLFTGTYLPWANERNKILKAVDDRFNLVIHSVNPADWISAGFKNVNGPIMDDALPELINKAKINLSIDHTIERGYWSDRNAQIMACGGFVLFRYVPLSEAVFRSNIAYFYDAEDCLNKIRYWLEADEDREMIAGQGYDNSEYYKVKERTADMLNIVRSIL